MENLSHGVSLSKLSIFLVFLHILIFFVDLRVIFLTDFLCIEEISVLYNRDSDFTNVQTKIEAKIWIFSLSWVFSLQTANFLSFCYRFLFLIDLRVVLEQIFISIEEISVLYNRDSDFITVQTRIEAKIWIFFSHSLSLDFFLHLLTFLFD